MDITDLLSKDTGAPRASVEVQGIKVVVREPSYGVYARYGQLVMQGESDAGIACLLKGCVIHEDGSHALNDEQAMKLAMADKDLVQPICNRIFGLMVSPEKKTDAPGNDDLPGGDSPGADAK